MYFDFFLFCTNLKKKKKTCRGDKRYTVQGEAKALRAYQKSPPKENYLKEIECFLKELL